MFELLAYGDAGWGDELAAGLLVTVSLALVTLPVGIGLGFAAAGCSLSTLKPLRWAGVGYTTVMRGLPELLTLFVVYHGLGLVVNDIWALLFPDARPPVISPFAAGVAALGLVFGAFAGEVLRGAFQSLDKGQIEAAQAVGMRPIQVFLRIKVPQVWRFALPGLGNLWINLLKDTSLVSIIALDDLLRMTKIAVGVTKEPFFFYLVACCLYWPITVASEYLIARMERHANRGIRRA